MQVEGNREEFGLAGGEGGEISIGDVFFRAYDSVTTASTSGAVIEAVDGGVSSEGRVLLGGVGRLAGWRFGVLVGNDDCNSSEWRAETTDSSEVGRDLDLPPSDT
jgi:hypothetical protein